MSNAGNSYFLYLRILLCFDTFFILAIYDLKLFNHLCAVLHSSWSLHQYCNSLYSYRLISSKTFHSFNSLDSIHLNYFLWEYIRFFRFNSIWLFLCLLQTKRPSNRSSYSSSSGSDGYRGFTCCQERTAILKCFILKQACSSQYIAVFY